MRWIENRQTYEKIIKENIDYGIIAQSYGKNWLDEIIEYIDMALRSNTSDVRNIRAFLITTIYRSFETADNWFSAKCSMIWQIDRGFMTAGEKI